VVRRKLVAAILCLAGAGAGVITLAGVTELRGYLTQQADQQLLAEADVLASHSLIAWPSEGGDWAGGLCLEVFDPGGQSLLPPNCGRGSPAIPARAAWLLAHAGRPVTVPGSDGGQSWRILAMAVHYRAHHIPYVYGASDYSLTLTGAAQPGYPATVVVGVGLAGVGHDVAGLAKVCLSLSIVMILAAAGTGAAAIRASLRPLTRIRETAEAAAGGRPPRGAGSREPAGEFAGLARAVNTITSRAAETLAGQAAAESAAAGAREHLRGALVAGLRDLREPLSVIAGFAEYYRQRAGRDADTAEASAPATEAPVAGVPAAGAPGAGVPATSAPGAEVPATGAPATGASATGASGAGAPVAGVPAAGAPGVGVPMAGVPAAGASGVGATGAMMARVAGEAARMTATVDALSEAAAPPSASAQPGPAGRVAATVSRAE
jgi:signal transduction histidine kinase